MRRFSCLKLSLLLAFVSLAVLLVFTIKFPDASDGSDAEVQRSELLRSGDEWIVQLTIANPEHSARGYVIQVNGASNNYEEKVTVPGGESFIFVYHARPETEGDGKTEFVVYRDGVSMPLDHQIYYLKANEL